MQDAEIERLRACCSPAIDWVTFDSLVGRHRILPTVYRNLSTHCSELVPPSALAELKEWSKASGQRTLILLSQLGRIAQHFSQNGIQLCALKGPLLAQRLFGDVGLRTSRDIDLLIEPEVIAEAESIMLAHGCLRSFPAVPLTPRQWRVYLQEWRHFVYYLPEHRIYVELHWALAPPDLVSPGDVRQMLSRARPAALAGTSIHTLSEEDLPVYLLIHGSVHSWVRLKWLVDFVVWMRGASDSDWSQLKGQMRALGLQRPLAQAVLLAHRLFSVPIPEPVQSPLVVEPVAQDMAAHSLKAISNARYSGAERGGFRRLGIILYRMKFKKELRYKWNTLTKIWTIPADWSELPLPDALYPLYWLLRPFLWLQRYHLRGRRGHPDRAN